MGLILTAIGQTIKYKMLEDPSSYPPAFSTIFSLIEQHPEFELPIDLINQARAEGIQIEGFDDALRTMLANGYITRVGGKLSLKKQSGDWHVQYDEHSSGSNLAGGGIGETQDPYINPIHNSILERENPSENAASSGPGGEFSRDPGAGEDDQWGESNMLRPLRRVILPSEDRQNPDFNSGQDSEYMQRQFGLNFNHQKKYSKTSPYDAATIQIAEIPQTVKDQIKTLQKSISTDDVYTEEDAEGWVHKGIQSLLHLTVLFDVNDNIDKKVQEIFTKYSPIEITADEVGYFDQEDHTVAIIKCSSDTLRKLHLELKKNIKNGETYSTYKPHITVAYLKPGKRLVGEFKPVTWKAEKIEISKSTGVRKKISFSLSFKRLVKNFLKKLSFAQNDLVNVCAYCHSLMGADGNPLQQLSDDELTNLMQTSEVSHGMCNACHQKQMMELQEYRKNKQSISMRVKSTQGDVQKFDGKTYTDCTGMGLSGSIGAAFEVIRRDNRSWVPSKRYQELKKLMKSIELDLKNDKINYKEANILDPTKSELDPKIWQEGAEGLPFLRSNIKVDIIKKFMDYIREFGGYKNPEHWIKNMFYTGSTATYKFKDSSDVDIHILVDWSDMLKANPEKEKATLIQMWQDLHDTFWWTLNKEKLPGTKHPLQYYVVRPGEEQKVLQQKEEIYDMGHDVWLIAPGARPVELTPQTLRPAIEEARRIIRRVDKYLMDARETAIDYDILKEMLNESNQGMVLEQLNEKLRRIDTDLIAIKQEYRKLKKLRQDAFEQGQPMIEGANQNYTLGNIVYKLVERYKIMEIMRKIQHTTDGQPVTHDQMGEVTSDLGIKNNE